MWCQSVPTRLVVLTAALTSAVGSYANREMIYARLCKSIADLISVLFQEQYKLCIGHMTT